MHDPICPIHDERLDDDGRCDHCDRDAALTDCPACEGEGAILPAGAEWEDADDCERCNGTGVVGHTTRYYLDLPA